ncbi:hypothetical protein [Caballeronia catudaia]|uniref:hypothetical protein n=1 Tax=Caballeronia catudaia TaxID=1777136 RepID=UPI001F1879C8|nr:hypothetical protein [Caballeronia catudaia]
MNTLERETHGSRQIHGAWVDRAAAHQKQNWPDAGFRRAQAPDDRSGRQDAYYPLKASRDAAKYAPGAPGARQLSLVEWQRTVSINRGCTTTSTIPT